jgi:hypothetical protein
MRPTLKFENSVRLKLKTQQHYKFKMSGNERSRFFVVRGGAVIAVILPAVRRQTHPNTPRCLVRSRATVVRYNNLSRSLSLAAPILSHQKKIG